MPISARIDDVNVCLRCEVIGRPAPAIFWTLDEHPVVMDTRNSGYWSLVRVGLLSKSKFKKKKS